MQVFIFCAMQQHANALILAHDVARGDEEYALH